METRVQLNNRGFSKWFTEISPWNPRLVPTERSVRVKVKGVPLHIWYEETFRRIALLVGRFVSIDVSTRDMVRLDYGRALVTTASPDLINKVVEIKVNEILYSIRIMEMFVKILLDTLQIGNANLQMGSHQMKKIP